MHRITGGLLCVVAVLLGFAAAASAQITGTIDTVGFGGRYRPGCWTPMLVRLSLAGTTPGNYELRVWQHDLDGDLPYFARPITLSGNGAEQSFWTAFLPEPIYGGLTNPGMVSGDLAPKLRVTVHDSAGKELAQIPLARATADSVDPDPDVTRPHRASRFVLFVGTAAAPPLRDYAEPEIIAGLKEDLAEVRLAPEQLPESVIAYEGIDAIVWLDGDPAQLSRGNGERLAAIRTYVQRGGHLVLASTPEQWQQLLGFGDLLPVDISGFETNALQSPVREMTARMRVPPNTPGAPRRSPWERYTRPMTIATATARPGAVVDVYADRVLDPKVDADSTPWLVRRSVGFGCVSWVGQGLGNRELSDRLNWGWSLVWETVLGANAAPVVYPDRRLKDRFIASARRDLGATVLDGMNLSGRAAQLVGLTILFFVGYWLLAGPGAFFWLRYKGRATLNWFAFGLMAVMATALTLALVRLVLRGPPSVRHVSLVRVDVADPTVPSIVTSRLGMYVPRDGEQRIALRDADLTFGPSIAPFPIHPTLHAARDGDRFLYPAPRTYRVAIPGNGDAGEAGTVSSSAVADVWFRTTMKRLRAQWLGPRDERVNGTPALQPATAGYIAGTLRNQTGHDLRNVYIAFRYQSPGGTPSDWVLYVAEWATNAPLDLAQAFNPPPGKTTRDITVGTDEGDQRPRADGPPVRGMVADWGEVFAEAFRTNLIGGEAVQVTDLERSVPPSVPVLSFFNRLPPSENEPRADGGYAQSRADLHRSGLREWDLSNALMAGRLVVVAQATNVPLPVPMDVESSNVEGSGTTIYQFVLPLTPIPTPATPATTRPTSQSTAFVSP